MLRNGFFTICSVWLLAIARPTYGLKAIRVPLGLAHPNINASLDFDFEHSGLYMPLAFGPKDEAQSLNLLVDTGGYNLWVMGKACPSLNPWGWCTWHKKYNEAGHRVPGPDGQPMQAHITYTGGRFSGVRVMDNFHVADGRSVITTKQYFVAASKLEDAKDGFEIFWATAQYDGVLGLGVDHDNQFRDEPWQKSVMDNLLPQMNQPMFSLWIHWARSPRKRSGSKGQLMIGDWDQQKCDTTRLKWHPLFHDSRFPYSWSLTMNRFYIPGGGDMDDMSQEINKEAIMDSGSPYIMVPMDMWKEIRRMIRPTSYGGIWSMPGYATKDCDRNLDELYPYIQFGTSYPGPQDLELQLYPSQYTRTTYPRGRPMTCEMLIRPFDGEYVVLGLPLMSTYCTAFTTNGTLCTSPGEKVGVLGTRNATATEKGCVGIAHCRYENCQKTA